jgi:uncharacterized protein
LSSVILDTGPLVALVDGRDRYHGWAVAQWNRIRPPLFTCESVVAEATYLLRKFPGGSKSLLGMVERRAVAVSFRLDDEATAVARLMAKYHEIPMSLADACLVRMSERISGSVVLTLDADFRVYRRHGRQVIPTNMPEA